ncbi:MAG: hypothetical protein HZC24_15190 [Rhodocyclales bacterium]|nr:hypothetical protein [Rhodocyclales bacterium]
MKPAGSLVLALLAASAAAQPLAARAGGPPDLFPAQTWTPAPALAPETQPVAPPLPFSFGGRYVEAGRTLVFLMEGERVHAVRVGDTIKGAYRVDAIEPTVVQLTYLPLNLRQSLPTGSVPPR